MYKYYHFLHLHHHFYYKKFLKNKYNDLVIADSLRQMAMSLIALFVPIYLLKLGFSFFAVALLELLMLIGIMIFHFIVVNFIKTWGVKQILVTSYLLNAGFYFFLYNSNTILEQISDWLFLFLIGIFNLSSIALYWIAHHVYFITTIKTKQSGTKTGIIMAFPVMFGIIGPLFGGFLITRFNFQLVFLISFILLIAASFSLFFSNNIKIPKPHLKLKKIIDSKHLAKNVIYILQGFGFGVMGFVWPLFMFFSAITLVGIGLVHLLSATTHSIFCYASGRYTDKHGNRRIAQIGVIGHGITLIGRSFITTVIGASIWQSLAGIFAGLNFVPLESAFYRYAKHDVYNHTLNRELYLQLGRITVFIILFGLLIQFSIIAAMKIILILSGLTFFLLVWFIQKDKTIIN